MKLLFLVCISLLSFLHCRGQQLIDSVLIDSISIDGSTYLRKQILEGDAKLVRVYFSNGEVYREYHLKDGTFDQYYKEWHPNGKLRALTPYRNGKVHGHWEEWNEEGKRILEADLVNGAGTMIDYYDDGITKRQVGFIDSEGLYIKPPTCFMLDGTPCECPKVTQ